MEFHRQSRLRPPPSAHGDVEVEMPPDVPKLEAANPLVRMMPLAMVIATVGMMAVYFSIRRDDHAQPDVHVLSGDDARLGVGLARIRGTRQLARPNSTATAESTCAISTPWIQRSREPPWITGTRCGGITPGLRSCGLWLVVRACGSGQPADTDFGHARVGCGEAMLSTRLVPPDLGSGGPDGSGHRHRTAPTAS